MFKLLSLIALLAVVLADHENASVPPIVKDIKIEGVDADSLAKLNEGLKSATNPEQRKAKIQEWESSLPINQKTAVKDYFEKQDQLAEPQGFVN